MRNKLSNLGKHIDDHCSTGSELKTLGIRKMPTGYALMLMKEKNKYYWLRHDGKVGDYSLNKWHVYRGAKADAENNCLAI